LKIDFREENLITNGKYILRHAKAGNAPQPQNRKNLTDYLSDMDVYRDSRQGKKNLPFLEKFSESEYIKI